MYRLDDLALFLRVLNLGSISAAARSLEISPAVASQRLKRLERALGVRLLQRSTRGLHATPEGGVLLEEGRTLVEDLEALCSGLHRASREVAGTLRVTMPPSFGRQYISPLLPEFLFRHPQAKLSVDLSDQTRDLVGAGFDLAIRIGALADSSLVARKLATNRRVLCASPAYLRKHGVPRTADALGAHECLRLVDERDHQDVWRLRDPQGRQVAVRVAGRIQSSQGELLRDAALAGLGIAQHSLWHVHEDLRAGRLQIVLPDYTIPETGIYAVMPQRRLMPPRVRAFVEFLSQQLGEHAPWEKPIESD